MHERVADEVGDDLAQPVLVARRRPPAPSAVGCDRPVGVDGPRVARRRRRRARRGRPGSLLERPALVEPGEEQQVVDEAAHAHRLLLGAAHRLVELVGVVEAAGAVELGVAADRRDRRAQLVRRVGDELAQAVLGRGALVEGLLDAAEHLVERDAELAGLGAGGRLGHPVREVAGGDRAAPSRSSA